MSFLPGKPSCCRTAIICLVLGSIVLQLFYFNKFTKPNVRFLQSDLFPQYPNKVSNVIIVSSTPRSGSSFTGEMISSPSYAAYFFEPLWYFVDAKVEPTPDMKAALLQNLLRCNIRDKTVKNILFSSKRSHFVFRKPSLADIKRFSLLSRVGVHLSYLHKMEAKCRKTRLRVVKTFRMTVQEVSELISTLPESGSSLTLHNTHLVYLVRDPRGIINSIQNRDKEWPAKFKDPEYVCSRILNESSILNSSLPFLTTVRYEDVASSPWNTLVQIFNNMNQSVPREARYFVQKHSAVSIPAGKSSKALQPQNRLKNVEEKLFDFVAAGKVFNQKETEVEARDNDEREEENAGKVKKEDDFTPREKRSLAAKTRIKPLPKGKTVDKSGSEYYFSTYRDTKQFSPNHWRETIGKAKLEEINSHPACQAVFHIHNYPLQ